jgi:tRNA G46 methylase TrmB
MQSVQQAAGHAGAPVQKKLAAALAVRGVVRFVTDEGELAVEPRTWYRESGEQYVEARRRDSGEHLRLRISEIRDVRPW